MKKTKFIWSLASLLLVALTGCFKDDDFDAQKFGLQSSDTRAIGFTLASKSPLTVGITGQAAALTVKGPVLTIEGTGDMAASDIKINIEYDEAAVTAQQLTPLPAGTYSVNTKTPTIKAGTNLTEELTVSVTNSDQLDPNKKYGIGLKITTVDGGYQIAKNLQTVVVGFTIKNRYDGIYRLQGYHNRPTLDYPYDTEIHLITTGPNTVIFYWPEVRSNGHPIGAGPNNSLSWYGADISPVIEFDLTTNLVTRVFNNSTAVPIAMYTGAGSRVSKFDPATHGITVDFNYNGNPARAFFDDLTYEGPRP